MSTSSDLGLTLDLIRELRRLGGTRIKVGEVEVVFEDALAQAAPKMTEAEHKKETEALLYGSSQ